MSNPSCPLAYHVRRTPRMISGGYGCAASGGRCRPHENCDELVKEDVEFCNALEEPDV